MFIIVFQADADTSRNHSLHNAITRSAPHQSNASLSSPLRPSSTCFPPTFRLLACRLSPIAISIAHRHHHECVQNEMYDDSVACRRPATQKNEARVLHVPGFEASCRGIYIMGLCLPWTYFPSSLSSLFYYAISTSHRLSWPFFQSRFSSTLYSFSVHISSGDNSDALDLTTRSPTTANDT
jgi:hypothetical protein